MQITKRVQKRLRKEHLIWHNLLADAGYSSGDNYAFLETENLKGYIPAHGIYKGGPRWLYLCKREKFIAMPRGQRDFFWENIL